MGSRKPLEIVDQAGLKNILYKAVNGSVYNWPGLKPQNEYMMGRIDLASVSDFENVKVNGLETKRLAKKQLEKLEVDETDSLTSDYHLRNLDWEFQTKQRLNEWFSLAQVTLPFWQPYNNDPN